MTETETELEQALCNDWHIRFRSARGGLPCVDEVAPSAAPALP
jgi:hypothetical protein